MCKVSEHTSWSANYFHRFVSAALAEARDSGVVPMASPDLVQVITGFGESGAALVSSGVDKIIFTGSTKVGRLVMQGASKHNLTPCVLELGGKDPFIGECRWLLVVLVVLVVGGGGWWLLVVLRGMPY